MAVAAIIFLIVFIVAAILLYRELNPEKIVPYTIWCLVVLAVFAWFVITANAA